MSENFYLQIIYCVRDTHALGHRAIKPTGAVDLSA